MSCGQSLGRGELEGAHCRQRDKDGKDDSEKVGVHGVSLQRYVYDSTVELQSL